MAIENLTDVDLPVPPPGWEWLMHDHGWLMRPREGLALITDADRMAWLADREINLSTSDGWELKIDDGYYRGVVFEGDSLREVVDEAMGYVSPDWVA